MPFDDAFRDDLRALLRWRRDVRRFRRETLPDGALDRLLATACLAPSVGLSQPWRFVVVDDPGRRTALRNLFARCNAEAASGYTDERAERYAALKLAGLDDAPAQVAVFADRSTAVGHGLGRRTMPEMADFSVVTAIHTLWLAARAEGIGLGWVSILEPAAVAGILDVPSHWRFIGHLCIGFPERESDTPELERSDWEHRRPPAEAVIRR
ncbi:5,6-dimethylbenzimidazole synthase [Lichenibacterium minor]|uniref:5,6-dimethylbenzimidazole synthase n=1 Tax=Lichenibacterium minor TaxID=2316528 RepID=A0A4Q2UC27_9HYPH|nr:5,6-dimethylbenzimidazole synthase [Lichenibacterium minor]RYC32727.1 5,6-dimethylbenzimidazole synthase [Lichenibacterium minor]